VRVCCGCRFPDREIEEPLDFFGPVVKERSCADVELFDLQVVEGACIGIKWYQSTERFFAFYSREKENSPCRQGEGTSKLPNTRSTRG
jgi:hypothetical protein